MLMHGRLILTASGFMLDEVRSLLQKSLRRKERALVTQATKELIGRGKDQLPWKSIVTFMFEDHCLNSEDVLLTLIQKYKNKDKYGCIELMLEFCKTCRVAACLPIIGMDKEYEPVDWDNTIKVEETFQNLVSKKTSRIDFGLLLQHLKTAWKTKNVKHLIAYMKLATMVNDHDERVVTGKGLKYCYHADEAKKPNPGMVTLTMLSKLSSELGNKRMEQYCRYCCKLATIPDVPVRLVLSAAVAQYIHSSDVNNPFNIKLGKVKWSEVGRLNTMPDWATDKHTYRGKFGRCTKHLLKKKKQETKHLTEAEIEEFHGDRSQKDIEHFFSEGVKCADEVLNTNPYWVRCKQLYLQRPKKLQKTIRMTAVYYDDLMKKYPKLKGISIKSDKKNTRGEISGKAIEKRKFCDIDTDESYDDQQNERKRQKTDHNRASTSTTQTSDPVEQKNSIQELEHSEKPCVDGPLLQLPTGSAKMYTRADLGNKCVWKGPYKGDRVSLVMFFHRVMREVLGDSHTLKILRNGSYVNFQLLHGPDATLKVTENDFYDCIGKKQVTNGKFLLRESLGIIQMHNLDSASFRSVPGSFWCHYLFRYMLNIGDSGLYNSITDKKRSFFFGIDMEEIRKSVMGHDLLNLMFVKLPRKELRDPILLSLRRQKSSILQKMSTKFDIDKIESFAEFYQVHFDREQFGERLNKVRNRLSTMKGGLFC